MKVTNPKGFTNLREWSSFVPGTILRFHDTEFYYLRIKEGLVMLNRNAMLSEREDGSGRSFEAVESLTLTSEKQP